MGGFSQGCAISVFYGLTADKELGGVVGFSGYLFGFEGFELKNRAKIPILLNHGVHDSMIPFEHAKKSYEKIQGASGVTFKQTNEDHGVNDQQVKDMEKWLGEVCKANGIN